MLCMCVDDIPPLRHSGKKCYYSAKSRELNFMRRGSGCMISNETHFTSTFFIIINNDGDKKVLTVVIEFA